MDLLSIAALAVVIALLIALWKLARSRTAVNARSRDGSTQSGKPQFETTLNELRDLREALRPSEPDARLTRRSDSAR